MHHWTCSIFNRNSAYFAHCCTAKHAIWIWSSYPSAPQAHTAKGETSPTLPEPLSVADMSESVRRREEGRLKSRRIRPEHPPGQRTQRSYSARRIGRFLGHGEHWHLSLCALYHPAIAGSIIVLTRTSCHWLPSAMSTYRRGLVVIGGSGLWLLWVIHNIHIQINRKAFAHGFVFALAFCSSQPSSVRVIAPVQSYKNTESDTRRNHQHGHAA